MADISLAVNRQQAARPLSSSLPLMTCNESVCSFPSGIFCSVIIIIYDRTLMVTEGRSSGVPEKLVQPSSALCYRLCALRPPVSAPAPDVSPAQADRAG